MDYSLQHAESTPAPKVTLIVAVYNAEKYFDTFMQSVFAQTFSDFEILLIDDGSNDRSGAMCDEYATRDSRIMVIHKENGGVASARQVGIDNARGEYTIHADPDDTIAPTFLEELYTEAVRTDADMVMCDHYRVKEHVASYRALKPRSLRPSDILDDLLLGKIPGYLCTKLIRRSLYSQYNISFAKGLNYAEDLLICVKLTLHDIKIAHVKKALYNYNLYINPNSITRTLTREKLELRLLFLKLLFETLPKGTHRKGANFQAAFLGYESIRAGILTDEEYKAVFRKFLGRFWMSRYSIKRKFALVLAAHGYQSMAQRIIRKR